MQTFLNSDQHLEDRPAVSSPPWVWFGFVFAIAFLSVELADLIVDFDKQSLQLIFALIVLGGWIYWLFLCPPISQDPGRDDWTPLSHPAGRGRGKTLHPLLQSLLAFCVAFDPFITSQSGRPGKYAARRINRFCPRSEEHTSELQSHLNLVCRLLLEKKNRHSLRVIQWLKKFTARSAGSSSSWIGSANGPRMVSRTTTSPRCVWMISYANPLMNSISI